MQKINAILKKSHYVYNKIFENNNSINQIIENNDIKKKFRFDFNKDIDEVEKEDDFNEGIEKELDFDKYIDEELVFDENIEEELDPDEYIEEELDFDKNMT